MKPIFPEILITGKLPEKWSKERLIADGLIGWACCMMGEKPPKMFGEGMALIGNKVGIATPDGLSKLADKLISGSELDKTETTEDA